MYSATAFSEGKTVLSPEIALKFNSDRVYSIHSFPRTLNQISLTCTGSEKERQAHDQI